MTATSAPTRRPNDQHYTFLGTAEPSILLQVAAKVSGFAGNNIPVITIESSSILNTNPTLQQYLDQLFGLITGNTSQVHQKFLELKNQLDPQSNSIEERIAYARCCLGLAKTTNMGENQIKEYLQEAEQSLNSIEILLKSELSPDQNFQFCIEIKQIFSDFAKLFYELSTENVNLEEKADNFGLKALAFSTQMKAYIQTLSKKIDALKSQTDLNELLKIGAEAYQWHLENATVEQDNLLDKLEKAMRKLDPAGANTDVNQQLSNIQTKRKLFKPLIVQIPRASSSNSPLAYLALATLGGIAIAIGIYFWKYRKVAVIQPNLNDFKIPERLPDSVPIPAPIFIPAPVPVPAPRQHPSDEVVDMHRFSDFFQ